MNSKLEFEFLINLWETALSLAEYTIKGGLLNRLYRATTLWEPPPEVTLHLLTLASRVIVDSGNDLLGLQELHKAAQLRETAVLTVGNTCVVYTSNYVLVK